MFLLAESTTTLPEELWRLATPLNVVWYVYALAGIGFYGGYEYWGFFGRALYWLVFPFHAGVIAVFLLAWGYIKLTVNDSRYISTPFIFILTLGGFTLIGGPLGFVIGFVSACIFSYQHWKGK